MKKTRGHCNEYGFGISLTPEAVSEGVKELKDWVKCQQGQKHTGSIPSRTVIMFMLDDKIIESEEKDG